MWSVIIPTMWKGVEWERMLPLLDSCKGVSDIFVIDNDKAKRPEWFNRNWQKVRVATMPKNIFCESCLESWCQRGSHRQYLVFLVVMFDPEIFNFLKEPLTGPASAQYVLRSFNSPQDKEQDIIPPLTNPKLVQTYQVPISIRMPDVCES